MLYGRCDEGIGPLYQPFAEALDWYTHHVARPVLGRHPGELSRQRPVVLVLGTYRDTEAGHGHTLAAMTHVRRLPGERLTLTGLPTQAPAAGRPLLSISTQEISLDDIGPDETLRAEIVDVVNLGGGELDWTVTTEADWIELEPQAGCFRLTMRPRPGVNRANVLVRDRGRGGSRTVRVSVRVRHHASSPRRPIRTRRRHWVPVAAMLVVATVGVVGGWSSRPRSTETAATTTTEAGISALDVLDADFRPLGFTARKQPEHIDLASLPTSGLDDTKQRWLRESGRRLQGHAVHPPGRSDPEGHLHQRASTSSS